MHVLYTTQVTATGGRTGNVRSTDDRLAVTLDTPKELSGAGGDGTNPEQLFAAGYSACFLSALKYVAAQKKVTLSESAAVTATVGIGARDDHQGFALDVALEVTIPDLDANTIGELIILADIACPYSYLARNGLAVRINAA